MPSSTSIIDSSKISHSNSLGSLLDTSELRCDAEQMAFSGAEGSSNLENGQSTSTLNCYSPSLLSLQRSLTHALQNPEQHTCAQLNELEQRRQRSIETLSKKAAERRLDLNAVCQEMEAIDQIRAEIFKTLSVEADGLLSRLRVHIVQVNFF